MRYTVADLEDDKRFVLFLSLSYRDLVPFIFEKLKRKSMLTVSYWTLCIIFLLFALYIRIKLAGTVPALQILMHSVAGLIILPIVCIPVHEFLHIIPYYLSGARNIRIGMDLKQYLFYVTAHKYVATPMQFRIVALVPFIVISTVTALAVILLPGVWKLSLSLFLFVHATMCAGDVALLNLYFLNRGKKLYTWDDADKKEAYFYEKLSDKL